MHSEFRIKLRKSNQIKNKGFSLISLMVGLLVSSVSLLAMMGLYKSVVYHIYDPISGSQSFSIRNQQNMAGLLSIQNLTQNAGFGIETAATNTTLILVENASLTFNSHHQKLTTPGTLVPIKFSAQTGNAIFWEENTTLSTNSNEYHCKGILSDINTKAVYALTASNSCSPIATLWSNQNWDITRIIKPDVLDAPLTITASLDVGKCSPFESEVSKSLLESQISELAGIESDAQIKAGLKISVGWSKAASYTPWTSCLTNFSG